MIMLEIMIWTKNGGYCTSDIHQLSKILNRNIPLNDDGTINITQLSSKDIKIGWLPKNDIWQGQLAIAVGVDLPKCTIHTK